MANSERYNDHHRDLDLIEGDRPRFKVMTTFHNAGPHTVWAKLAERLGQEPTNEEAKQEVLRIMREAKR